MVLFWEAVELASLADTHCWGQALKILFIAWSHFPLSLCFPTARLVLNSCCRAFSATTDWKCSETVNQNKLFSSVLFLAMVVFYQAIEKQHTHMHIINWCLHNISQMNPLQINFQHFKVSIIASHLIVSMCSTDDSWIRYLHCILPYWYPLLQDEICEEKLSSHRYVVKRGFSRFLKFWQPLRNPAAIFW